MIVMFFSKDIINYYYICIDFPIILSKMFRIDYKKGRINLKTLTS